VLELKTQLRNVVTDIKSGTISITTIRQIPVHGRVYDPWSRSLIRFSHDDGHYDNIVIMKIKPLVTFSPKYGMCMELIRREG
jgi:hypothetical protein